MSLSTLFRSGRQITTTLTNVKEANMRYFVHCLVSLVVTLSLMSFTHYAAASGGKATLETNQMTDTSSDVLDESPKTDNTNPYLRSDILLWTATGIGVLHHTDHVLRGNHSGFPFTPNVNEFTFSLGIYPILLGGYALDAGPNYWILTESLAFAGLGLAHTLIEPPNHQHRPWARGTNLLGVNSSSTGRGAQFVSLMLSAGIGAHLVSSIVDGAQCGFTWTRKKRCTDERKQQTMRFNVGPTDSGMTASIGWRW